MLLFASPVDILPSSNSHVCTSAQELLQKIRTRLDEDGLNAFRREAAAYMRGSVDAASYYAAVSSLGLSSLVPEMAALLPDPDKRAQLLSMHSAAESSAADAAAVSRAARFGSWQCSRCGLVNGPSARLACEGCQARKPRVSETDNETQHEQRSEASSSEDFPALNGASASEDGSRAKVGVKRNKKVPKFERLRLTGGDPQATAAFLETKGGTVVKPQNAWTQGRPALAGGGAANPRGQWAKQGKLASEWRNINGAWDKK
jgi:hypothetical protein